MGVGIGALRRRHVAPRPLPRARPPIGVSAERLGKPRTVVVRPRLSRLGRFGLHIRGRIVRNDRRDDRIGVVKRTTSDKD